MSDTVREPEHSLRESDTVRAAAHSRHVPEAELEAVTDGDGTQRASGAAAQSPSTDQETVLVIDFGAQYSRLIARRIREANVYCEILPHDVSWERIDALRPRGIVLSGGPASVYE